MKLVYEVNGNDVFTAEARNTFDLSIYKALEHAAYQADKHGVPLSDVSLRFVEG